VAPAGNAEADAPLIVGNAGNGGHDVPLNRPPEAGAQVRILPGAPRNPGVDARDDADQVRFGGIHGAKFWCRNGTTRDRRSNPLVPRWTRDAAAAKEGRSLRERNHRVEWAFRCPSAVTCVSETAARDCSAGVVLARRGVPDRRLCVPGRKDRRPLFGGTRANQHPARYPVGMCGAFGQCESTSCAAGCRGEPRCSTVRYRSP
jgi:hypothetical protein